MHGVFCLFSAVIYSYLRLSNGDKVIRSYDIKKSFTRWDECRHYSSGIKTQLHKHIPFSQFPLVPRLFCIIINILSPFYDQFSRTIASGYSREGTNTACYISKNGLPFESTQRERTMTLAFPIYIAKLQTRKNT